MENTTTMQPLTERCREDIQKKVDADPTVAVARNAVTAVSVNKVALDRNKVLALDPTVEVKLDSLKVTDQKTSGRCWMFAALNMYRQKIATQLNLEQFEFSEAYLQYFDKLEKAYFALNFLLGSEEPHAPHTEDGAVDLSDRRTAFVLDGAADDGGLFNYVNNLVAKYGVVPSYAMPDSDSASNTPAMNRAIHTIVRRTVMSQGSIDEAMKEIQRVVGIHLGTPPTSFVWQYRDKDGNFHREGEFTPQEFAQKYLPDLDQYVEVAFDARADHEPNQAYDTDLATNVWGRPVYRYVNADIETVRSVAIKSIKGEDPVWFGCDVNTQFDPMLGMWDRSLINLEDIYGVDMGYSREGRMMTWEVKPTHAMVLTGYDEQTKHFRVENSWGVKDHKGVQLAGDGYGTMSSEWFADNVFSVVVKREYVPQELLKAWDGEAILLPCWDPMS
ncbi:peptidase C1 [Corynebacterium pyruviciproducens]|uniref:aminopeptidase C n=1 Tax=Corynebacterium pyruviciproducens TaxID=598660 RepID=UPI0024570CAF|nr:C1 family peptidase [Corynebacterium pyruviciproducens]MDH4658790.1 peptidase C1 [Corynebacterium pyruviciproducens]